MEMYTQEFIDKLYEMLEPLTAIEQPAEYHPEANAYVHSFQVLYHALRETADVDLIFAALMHDVGKQVNRLGHEKHSVEMCKDVLSAKSLWFIEQHMRVKTFLAGEMKRPEKAKELAEHPWFPKLVQLSRWDLMGRRPNWSFSCPSAALVVRLNDLSRVHFKPRYPLSEEFRKVGLMLMAEKDPKGIAQHILDLEYQLKILK